jgi:hypothetical protein
MVPPAYPVTPLLAELNDALRLEGVEPVDWVVCGGTALLLQGLIARTTRDVDVLGDRPVSGIEVGWIGTFPPPIDRAIRRVARVHPELQYDGGSWVNLGAQELVRRGLPEGFEARLVRAPIGDRLTLHLLARVDLIALKLLAASDDLGRRQRIHLDDLRELRPTGEELAASIGWVERQTDTEPRLRAGLKRVVEELGHDDLAYYITV